MDGVSSTLNVSTMTVFPDPEYEHFDEGTRTYTGGSFELHVSKQNIHIIDSVINIIYTQKLFVDLWAILLTSDLCY